jgi:DNA polymerase-1
MVTDERTHRLYLIDGSGYIFRAYHALPPLTRSDGLPTGAVAGFCNMLAKLLEKAKASGEVSHLAVVFDYARKTFRNDIYPAYKANREAPPEDLVPQFPLVRQAVKAFNVAAVEAPGFEADDVIATYTRLAREQGAEVIIVSSDKDLMQLVQPGVSMFDPVKEREIGVREVEERFGVPPAQVVDVMALAGDSSDNVPGVPGIGVKTAAELIGTYHSLDELLARADEIKQPKRREALQTHAEDARLSRTLVTLRDDVALEETLEDLTIRPIEPKRLMAFLDELEFRALKARIERQLAEPPARESEALAPRERAKAAPVPRYELVQTTEALHSWIARAQTSGQVAVDTETTSLDPAQADLVGVSLSVAPGSACYIPLGHSQKGLALARPPQQIPLPRALALLKPLLENESVLKIGQNFKYDMVVLARRGIRIKPIDDTMLISYVLDSTRHGHGLDELAALHLGRKTITYEEVTGRGNSQINFAEVALDQACAYAAEDAEVTLELHRLLKPRLFQERLTALYETVERPLVAVIAEMEETGVRVDHERLKLLSDDFARRMAALESKIHALAGEDFNVGSPKQLADILFSKLSLTGTASGQARKGKSGALSTSADVLEALAAEGHELPRLVLEWRQLQKLKGTYTDSLQAAINPLTGRVHTSFALAATSTGRLASSNPNLQNIPIRTEDGRKIRRAFIAEDGCKLLSADYSQIELRLLAHIADVKPLKQAFADGLDIHALTAAQVFGVPIEKVDAGLRRSAKTINFGLIYGMSAFGLSQQLGIEQAEAKKYIDAYFGRYPGIRDYIEATKATARARGFVTTLYGRRCYYPAINAKNPAERSAAERAAINAPLQGSAADIIKRAMVRLPKALAEKNLKARLVLQVHDELVVETPTPAVEETGKVVRQVMEGAADLSVPLVVDVAAADNWDDAH